MKKELYLSLCIPTNGVTEWVIPVLESIYIQNCDSDEFEVIITDNGTNPEFESRMREFEKQYNNFIYKKTEAVMFLNQIEAFKLANGKLIKFVNHRMTLLPKAVDYLIRFSKDYCLEKPVPYFSNGVLRLKPITKKCSTFDEYAKTLKNWSSWSAGTAIWKCDFEKMNINRQFDQLFPHIDIIFSDKSAEKYIVDDTNLMKELPTDDTKKGKYDLFNAFAVHYMDIIHNLYEESDISKKTFEHIRSQNEKAISRWYFDFVVAKKPCSYDLSGYKDAIGKYYNDIEIKKWMIVYMLKRSIWMIKGMFK